MSDETKASESTFAFDSCCKSAEFRQTDRFKSCSKYEFSRRHIIIGTLYSMNTAPFLD